MTDTPPKYLFFFFRVPLHNAQRHDEGKAPLRLQQNLLLDLGQAITPLTISRHSLSMPCTTAAAKKFLLGASRTRWAPLTLQLLVRRDYNSLSTLHESGRTYFKGNRNRSSGVRKGQGFKCGGDGQYASHCEQETSEATRVLI